MTCFIQIDGVEVAGSVKLPGLQSVSARADGSYTDSGLLIDDPGGTATYQQLSLVTIDETASTDARAFTGYVHRSAIRRGPYRDGAARVHELEVADLNFLLHLRVLTAADAKRPAETFNARMTWLLASTALSGLVYDDGLIASSVSGFDTADYRGRYADDVLGEIAGALGRIFFVCWDHSTARPSLFCDLPSAAVHSSTLRISNVDTDVDSTTTFAPLVDSDVVGAGEDIYDGVYFQWVGPAIYRQRTSTFTTFGIHRDASYETTRIGRLATAETYAQLYLDNHDSQIDTITCSVRLPRAKLTLIEAGMRIQVRFSHLPGYESFTWVRVTAKTFTFSAGRNDFYDVQLELSNRGLAAVPGGSPGDFPLPQACTPGSGAFVQAADNNGFGGSLTLTLPAPATAGNLVVITATQRNGGITGSPTGFTALPVGSVSPFEDSSQMWYRIAESGDQGWTFAPNSGSVGEAAGVVAEFETGVDFEVSAELVSTDPYSSGPSFPGASITPTSGRIAVIVGAAGYKSDYVTDPTAGAGWTLTGTAKGGVTRSIMVHQVVASTTGSYTPGFVSSATPVVFDSHSYGAQTAAFICTAGDNPPAPGQWVFGEVVTMSGSSGTTDHPFATGSLMVWVDDIDQTAALVSSDGATGTFVLSFVPTTTEIVKVDYQGI